MFRTHALFANTYRVYAIVHGEGKKEEARYAGRTRLRREGRGRRRNAGRYNPLLRRRQNETRKTPRNS